MMLAKHLSLSNMLSPKLSCRGDLISHLYALMIPVSYVFLFMNEMIFCFNPNLCLLNSMQCNRRFTFDMSRNMTKPTKWPVRPAKTQISLGIRPICSVQSIRCPHEETLYP